MKNENKRGNNKKIPFTGIGLILGTAIGAALSIIMTGNTLIWAGAGTGLGLITGAIADSFFNEDKMK